MQTQNIHHPRESSPRIVFSSIDEAQRSTPFFIDEEGIGPWLGTDHPEVLSNGTVIHVTRDAIHIPTLQQNGRSIPIEVRAKLEARAYAIGLTHSRHATGYWTLRESGELQRERVTIAISNEPIDPTALRNLAALIITETNQDAVAIEISGKVEQIFAQKKESPT